MPETTSPCPSSPSRPLKWTATVCALPSWVLLAAYVGDRLFVGTHEYLPVDLVPVPAAICLLATLASMILYPLGMDEHRFGKRDVLWLVGAELPLLVGLVYWVISFLGGGDFMPDGR